METKDQVVYNRISEFPAISWRELLQEFEAISLAHSLLHLSQRGKIIFSRIGEDSCYWVKD
jgi:hypothetical protein